MDSSHQLSNPLPDSNEELSIKIRELYYRLKLFSDAIEVSRQQAKPSIVVSRADQERQDHGSISDTGYLSPSPIFQGNDERSPSTRAAFQRSQQLPIPNPGSSATTTNLDIDSRTLSCWKTLVAVVFAAASKNRDLVLKGGEASHTVAMISASSLSQFRGSLRRISQGHNWVHEVKRVTQFVDLVAKACHKITITTVINDTPDDVHLAMGFAKTLAIGMTSSLSPELRGLLKRLVRLSKPFDKTLGNYFHAMAIGVLEEAGEKLPVAHVLGMLFTARAYIWTFVLDILLTTPDGRPISDFRNNVWAPNTSLSTALSRLYPEHISQGVERQLVANHHFVSLTHRLTKQFSTNEYFCMDFLHNWVYDSTQFDLILLTSDPFRCFQFVIDAADLDTFKHTRGQNSSLADILVLTGADNVACASPMGEYASKLWPELGPLLIGHLSQVLRAHFDGQSSTATVVYEPASGDESSLDLSKNLRFYSLSVEQGRLAVTVQATVDIIVESLQILAWAHISLSRPPFGDQLGRGRVDLAASQQQFVDPVKVELSLVLEPVKMADVCWLPLFSQAVLAWGYPVPSQRDGLIGLEIDLEVLSALSGARHAVIFRGGLLLKGLAVILVPTKRRSNTIQWHLVTNDDDCRLTCEDAVHRAGQRILCDELDLESYSSCRHIVGWCSKIKVMLGTSDFDYGSVSYSGTENATNMVRSAGKMALGIQQIVAAQVEFSVGKRVGKYAFRRQGSYERILKIASKTPIVLFDTGLRRGWLTPALAVMLHVVQLAIHSNPPESDKNKPLAFKGTALQTLLDHRDKRPVTGDSLADEISTIWNFIDYMIEVNVHEDTAVEQPVRGTLREVLYGFELMDLTEQTSPVHRKKLYVHNTHGGWPALVRDIDALVLFGNGFGDIMLPIEPSLCPAWATMPQGHDFLASTVETLVELYKKAGSQDWKYLTTQKLQWHRGTSALFEPCEFHASCCTCVRLQRIVPNEAVGHVTGPGPLDTEGAVIFGQLGRPLGLNNFQNAIRESFGLQKPQDTNGTSHNDQKQSIVVKGPSPVLGNNSVNGSSLCAPEPPHRSISGLIPGYRKFSRRRNMELN